MNLRVRYRVETEGVLDRPAEGAVILANGREFSHVKFKKYKKGTKFRIVLDTDVRPYRLALLQEKD